MLRDLLLLVLVILVARAASAHRRRRAAGIGGLSTRNTGIGGDPRQRPRTARGVQMVRDPVCGTYVVPDRALALTDGSGPVFFCSADCRDKYRARPSGRTA